MTPNGIVNLFMPILSKSSEEGKSPYRYPLQPTSPDPGSSSVLVHRCWTVPFEARRSRRP
jgi:hypothetical protein